MKGRGQDPTVEQLQQLGVQINKMLDQAAQDIGFAQNVAMIGP